MGDALHGPGIQKVLRAVSHDVGNRHGQGQHGKACDFKIAKQRQAGHHKRLNAENEEEGFGDGMNPVRNVSPDGRRDDADGGKRGQDGPYFTAGKAVALQQERVVSKRRHGHPV